MFKYSFQFLNIIIKIIQVNPDIILENNVYQMKYLYKVLI